MRIIRALIASSLLILTLALPVNAFAASTSSGSSGEACKAIGAISPEGGTCKDSAGPSVNSLISTAINLLSLVAGVIAVIMLIVSGFKYITSQGDAGSITSAKNSLLYAIIGLVVVVFAQILVKFVLSKAT